VTAKKITAFRGRIVQTGWPERLAETQKDTTWKAADGKEYPRAPYDNCMGTPCHDCVAIPGELHVPGCDMERCPKCGGQWISCGCEDYEENEV
jgi:hypothetical protein